MDSTIGPYRIESEVGRGGMGVVYRALDTRLDRTVAIKSLPEHLAADPDRLARFEREAKLLAQLNHPNVASIHGVEEQNGDRYLVLEFVEGETLADRLDRGNLQWDEAQEIAIQIASGVQAAHDAGVIHRDLKPANIKITPEGKVKVLDFGLARVDDSGASSSSVSQMPTLTSPVQHSPTMAGVILGTAAYMSPEQARGRSIDKRTDIWSFGVMLFEMLTGASPFVGETATDSIGAILHKELDYAHLPKSTPPLALHTLRRCLQRSRDKRYHDFGDVILDLQEAIETEATSLSPGPWRALSLTCLAIAAIAIGALTWALSRAPSTEQPVVHTSIQAPEGMKIEGFELSADGQMIGVLCERLTDGRAARNPIDELYVRRLSDQAWTKVPQSEGTYTFWFSPDNSTLVFITRGQEMSSVPSLMRTDALATTTPVEILRIPLEYLRGIDTSFCWTPEGELAFYSEVQNKLVIHDAGTGNVLRDIPLKLASNQMDLQGFTGPFGTHYIKMGSSGYTTDGYQNDIVLVDLVTGEAKVVLENARALSMLDGGRVAFARGDSVFVSEFDSKKLELVGAFRATYSG
ncbi:MAG: serine/threonine protein kinase, partial [Planctomycetota bacterium]